MRVGETSHPGPVTEDVRESFEERINDALGTHLSSSLGIWSKGHLFGALLCLVTLTPLFSG